MKKLLLSLLVVCSLTTIVGCSSDQPAASTSNQSASMTTDTKDMHPAGH